jgi:hypothetical protein
MGTGETFTEGPLKGWELQGRVHIYQATFRVTRKNPISTKSISGGIDYSDSPVPRKFVRVGAFVGPGMVELNDITGNFNVRISSRPGSHLRE